MTGFRMSGNGPELPLLSEAMLDAYVDGELDQMQRSAVEAHIEQHPAAATYLARERELRRELHHLLDARAREPLPPGILHRAVLFERATTRATPPPSSLPEPARRSSRLWIAALAACFVAAFLGGILIADLDLDRRLGGESLIALLAPGRNADAAMPEWGDILPAEAIVGSPNDQPGPGANDDAPDLSAQGFSLVSIRTLANGDGNAVQLVYENDTGTRAELFYGPARNSTRDSVIVLEDGPVTILSWNTLGRSFNLLADIDRKALLALGQAVNAHWLARSSSGAALQDGGAGTPAAQDDNKPAADAEGSAPLENGTAT